MISVVIPVYNEEQVLCDLYSRLSSVLDSIPDLHEVIVVDDGSTDHTKSILLDLHSRDPRWKLLSLSRNFGHQAAVSAGLHYSCGDAVAVMDGDLQDPPEELHRLLEAWRDGYQVVYAVRTLRKEGLLKRLAYWAFYRILRGLSALRIPLDSGDFCVMDRTVVEVLRSQPERTRFMRGLRTWAGFRQTGITYERPARGKGATKYSLARLFALAVDGIVSFSNVPLRIASWLGIGFCTSAALLVLFVLFWWASGMLIWGMRPANVLGWTSLFCMVLLGSGMQMLLLGIIGEYLARVYDEAKGRDPWIIGDARGFDEGAIEIPTGWHVSGNYYDQFVAPRKSVAVKHPFAESD
jgi:polyisoprenyl-phosphate glycosyltransferase